MLCGPFMVYTSLRILTFDGGDCSQTEAWVNAFAIISFIAAAIAVIIGLRGGTPQTAGSGLIVLGVLVALGPFMLYIVLVALALNALTLVVFGISMIYDLIVYKYNINRKNSTSTGSKNMLSEVAIDHPHKTTPYTATTAQMN